MADFDVTRQDVESAANFLRSFLSASLPDGDFTEGGVNDYVIDGVAYSVAYLLKQVKAVRDRQSLQTIRNLPDGESKDDAADAIGDNFFVQRKRGSFAKMPAVIHLNQKVDSVIPRNNKFWRDRSHVFYVDSSTDIIVPATQLRPNYDTTGRLIDWVATIFLTAARVGSDFNIRSGRFVDFDRWSPYVTFVENITDAAFGLDVEATADFIDTTSTALSLRALINARSNDALLRQTFPGIDSILTVGYGEPEMTRDLLREATSGTTIHLGGHVDIYVRLPTQEVVETETLGASAARADGRVLTFRDTTKDFVALDVVPGDVLFVQKGLPETPAQYIIVAVRTTELDVDGLVFSRATDEDTGDAVEFTYTVGDNYPSFNNKTSATDSVTVATTRQFAVSGGVILTGRPTYQIKRVTLFNPTSALAPFADARSGLVQFTKRSNGPITHVPSPGDELEYSVEVLNPGAAQSSQSMTVVHVAWPGLNVDGAILEVVYDTLSGFPVMSSYIDDLQNRVSAANTLLRGRHPVYIAFTVPYSLRVLRATRLNGVDLATTVASFDELGAALSLVSYINAYADQNPLDQSLLATQARATGSGVAGIYPFTVEYDLLGPDGRVFHYATEDVVNVFPDGVTSSARLLNPEDFGLPTTGYYAALRKLLTESGVSVRTLLYLATPEAVTFERRT